MRSDTKELWQAAFFNVSAGLGYVSTLSTFFPVPDTFRPYLRLLGVVLIVVGVFRGGLRVIAKKNNEIQAIELAHEAEVESFNKRIVELERNPFDEALGEKVESELKNFDVKECVILKALLHYEPWDYNKVMPSLTCTVQEQADVLRKGYGSGLLITDNALLESTTRAHYRVRPQYLQAVKKYLYKEPKGLERMAGN
jgi:hypothetical protein